MSNNKANRTFKEFLWEMLSEKEYISSKRVAGMLMILTALGCTIYLAIKEGGSSVVEDLVQTAFIVGSSLLGLASVTSIWKGGRVMASNQPQDMSQYEEPQPKKRKKKVEAKYEQETADYEEYDSPLREDDYSETEEYDSEKEKH